MSSFKKNFLLSWLERQEDKVIDGPDDPRFWRKGLRAEIGAIIIIKFILLRGE